MKFFQTEIELRPFYRGFHLITEELISQFSELKNIEMEDKQLDMVKEQLSLYLKSSNNIDHETKDLNVVSLFNETCLIISPPV